MADRTNNQVIFTLTAETAKLQAGLDRAEAMLRNFSQKTKAAGVGDDVMGGLGGAIKIGAAMKAVDVVFKTSAVVLENYNGPAKNFSSLIEALGKTISQSADELVKAVPVFGQSLSALIKLARGDDIKDAQAAEAKRAERQGRAFALARAQTASRFVEQAEDLRETRRIESISDEREREVAKLERQKQLALKKAEEQYRAAPGAEQSRELRNAYAQVRKEIEIEYEARKADKLKEIDKRVAEEAKKAAEEAKKAAEDKAREQERWAREAAAVESEIRQQQFRAAGNELAAQLDQIRTSYQERIDAAKKAGQEELANRLAVLQKLKEAEVSKAFAVKQAVEDENEAKKEAQRMQVGAFAAGSMYAGGSDGADAWGSYRKRMAASANARAAEWQERRKGVAMWGQSGGRDLFANADVVGLFRKMLAGIEKTAGNTAGPKQVVVQ